MTTTKCRNCDSDTRLGFRRFCHEHAAGAAEDLLKALTRLEAIAARYVDEPGELADACANAESAISYAEGR